MKSHCKPSQQREKGMGLKEWKKIFMCLIFSIIFGLLGTILIWDIFHSPSIGGYEHLPRMKTAPVTIVLCDACNEIIRKASNYYAKPWKREEENYQKFSSKLNSTCNGSAGAIVTQANTPLNSKTFYFGEPKKKIDVTPELFKIFPKESPFPNKKWDTCSVVGNGGILIGSHCGKQIDSAQFVFRCNIPPLTNGFDRHVGNKTDLVTANPSIFYSKFYALKKRTHRLIDNLHQFGNAFLLLPAFSYRTNKEVCLRVVDIVEDFESPIKPIFFNSVYLRNLQNFWRSLGLKENRLSTGLMIVSLALELCNRVDLYGFWPFGIHPERFTFLTNHYYDNKPAKKRYHSIPSEFDHLLKLHSQGVLRMHLGDCRPGGD